MGHHWVTAGPLTVFSKKNLKHYKLLSSNLKCCFLTYCLTIFNVKNIHLYKQTYSVLLHFCSVGLSSTLLLYMLLAYVFATLVHQWPTHYINGLLVAYILFLVNVKERYLHFFIWYNFVIKLSPIFFCLTHATMIYKGLYLVGGPMSAEQHLFQTDLEK